MLLSESNFKIGDIIKTSVSNCFDIIVPENWSHNRLPTLSELGTNINLNHTARSIRSRSVDGPPPPAGHKLDHVEPIIPSADPPQIQHAV